MPAPVDLGKIREELIIRRIALQKSKELQLHLEEKEKKLSRKIEVLQMIIDALED